MKRRLHLHPEFIVLTALSLVLMSGLVVYAYLQQQSTLAIEPLVPTRQPDHRTAIGGQPESQTPPTSTPSSTTPPAPAAPQTHHSQPHVATPPQQSSAPKQDEIIASVTKEYPYTALAAAPNDPYYASSWAMQRTGAVAAWNISTGTAVTVAVIDTGFALQHEDLTTQWATNTGEQGMTSVGERCWTGTSQDKTSNSCDDDNNGYVDDFRGWNFVSKNNTPQAGMTNTNGVAAISHGTAVAGLIGAATNNAKGVASYNWNAKVMPLQTLDDNGGGVTSSIIAAIYYAADNGATVINMSLGGPQQDPALQPAIDYAYSKGVVVVAAAGNCGTTGDAGCEGMPAPQMMYPALSNHVIAVGATDGSDARASFSSYGPGLDVVAPGSGSIISPLIDTRTTPYNYTSAYSGSLYGTSFASPVVSGIVALIKSIRPATSVDDVTALIDGSASKVAAMSGQTYTAEHGHGLINAGTASLVADSLTRTATTTPTLMQTGDHRSEHGYSSTSAMSTGCKAAPNNYCTVRMVNTSNGFDRYLPFAKTSASGVAGWQWSGAILGSGEWSLRATQGDAASAEYYLFSK